MQSVKFKQGLLQEAIISEEQVAVQGKDPLAENTLEFTIYNGFKIKILKL